MLTPVLFFLCAFSVNARCSSYIVITSTNSPILLLAAHPEVPLPSAEARNPLQSGGHMQEMTRGSASFPITYDINTLAFILSVDGWTDRYIKLFLRFSFHLSTLICPNYLLRVSDKVHYSESRRDINEIYIYI